MLARMHVGILGSKKKYTSFLGPQILYVPAVVAVVPFEKQWKFTKNFKIHFKQILRICTAVNFMCV